MQEYLHDVVNVNIVVTDDYLDHFSEIMDAMRQARLSIQYQADEFGLVSGTIELEKISVLNHVRGIGAVEKERGYHLHHRWATYSNSGNRARATPRRTKT